MERCEPTQWFNNHKGFTFFSDEPHHKGLVHLPLSESFEAEIRSLSTTIRGTTHNGIGGSRTATSDHQGSQPPHGRLGSKDPRVTSSQAFNFHESSWRAQTDATKQWLKSFTLKSHQKQLMLMGGEERKNKDELNKWNLKN